MLLVWLLYRYVTSSRVTAAEAEAKDRASNQKEEIVLRAGRRRPDLPDYSFDEISEHTSKENRIWVTFHDGVYDITDFIGGHPGGERILMAVGGALEPFWDLYGVHKSVHVLEILEEMRIGNILSDEDKKQLHHETVDYFLNEPKRHPVLKMHTEKPFNAETPRGILVESFLTPNEFFFVRNHLPVPDVRHTGHAHRVEIGGVGIKKPVVLNVDNLKRNFKIYKVTTTMQCSGNRRSDMHKLKPVKGLPWSVGAISTAEWTGVKLSDVLAYVGADESKVNHVIFQGLDRDMDGSCFEASIPAATAFDPRRDVLLAFEMNGKELPVDHGYPLRVVVPGTIGARQVKWLHRITISETESQSFWQQKDYKTFNPSAVWEGMNLITAKAIQEYPVQAAICLPEPGTTITGDYLVVKGYAISGGGNGIVRVDVTLDGGESWYEAKLSPLNQAPHREWAWTLWETSILLPKGHKGEVEIAIKATDTSHNTQPETDSGIWNARGLLETKWHRVKVYIDTPKQDAKPSPKVPR